ncbi:MAG: lysoplasmalogenase [bacterium]|jgi:uncharacterized membrane protein YhhN
MKSRNLFLLFAAICVSEILLLLTGTEQLRYLTKPLIIPVLGLIYYTSLNNKVHFGKDSVILALLFSWIGDVLLHLDGFFIPGLISFLIAHVFYIIFLSTTRSDTASFFKLRPVMLIAVMAYLIELMYLLWPHLGDMKFPVLFYGITISTMLSAALWQYQKLDNRTATYFILGALFFVTSDSLLAFNKFRQSFEFSGAYIMTTYIIAQLFIVVGAIRYRNT